jgi:multimeric flavodoxin WrbA
MRGNTALLLDEALKGAKQQGADIDKIIVDKLDIQPCREYYGCEKDGKCVIKDDMDSIYQKLLDADRVILASPMFFYGLTSQVKALIDRCQALWVRKHVLQLMPPDGNRKGAFIAVGATKGKNLFDGSILTVKYFFESIGIKYTDELLARGIDKKGEVEQHPGILSQAFELGKRLVKEK